MIIFIFQIFKIKVDLKINQLQINIYVYMIFDNITSPFLKNCQILITNILNMKH